MGHWLEILGLLLLALLVFGPKRLVEMGSSVGKMVRDFRESTKDLNLSQMLSGTESDDDDLSARVTPMTPVAPTTPHIVEGSIERPIERDNASAGDSQ
jgi:sec-independent protein translocase protein TatA